jgi:hypothetical protein
MRATPLGGAGLAAGFGHVFTETVTILRAVEGDPDEYGTAQVAWTPRPGLDAVPATVNVFETGQRVLTQEVRLFDLTRFLTWKRVLLQGPCPTVASDDRVRWDGFDWNIVALLRDPFGTFLELLIEQVVPSRD